MKFTKILALALVAVMMMLTFAACGGKGSGNISVTVTVKDENGEVLGGIENVSVRMDSGMKYDEALVMAVDGEDGFDYEYPADGDFTSLTFEDVEYAQQATDDAGVTRYWTVVSLNGEEKEVSMTETVNDGDVIVFQYKAGPATMANVTVVFPDGTELPAQWVKVDQYGKALKTAEIIQKACEANGKECNLTDDSKNIKDVDGQLVAGFECVNTETTFGVEKIEAGMSVKVTLN